MTASQTVQAAIEGMKALDATYWGKTLQQRLPGGAGSTVLGFDTSETLEAALLSANWEEYTPDPSSVMPGCQYFVTRDITGFEGLIDVETLDPSTLVVLDDPKGTGKLSCLVSVEVPRAKADFTVLVVGEEDGRQVAFTFHPGAPVSPSIVEVTPGEHKGIVSPAEALKMGFKWAKQMILLQGDYFHT
jgi:hypothetical protein